MSDFYTLDDGRNLIRILDGPRADYDDNDKAVLKWAKEMERLRKEGKKIVAQTTDVGPQQLRVSTVFLGLDHNFSTSGPPHVFETMVFGPDGWGDLYCERYSSWAEAEIGHGIAVEAVEEGRIVYTTEDMQRDEDTKRFWKERGWLKDAKDEDPQPPMGSE